MVNSYVLVNPYIEGSFKSKIKVGPPWYKLPIIKVLLAGHFMLFLLKISLPKVFILKMQRSTRKSKKYFFIFYLFVGKI